MKNIEYTGNSTRIEDYLMPMARLSNSFSVFINSTWDIHITLDSVARKKGAIIKRKLLRGAY